MNSIEASEIIHKIRQADWYYNYSDDYSAWKRGQESVQAVKNVVKSREWTADDIATLKLEVVNQANLSNYKKEEDREKNISWMHEKIDDLFRMTRIKE